MQKKEEAERWLSQAENDLKFANIGIREKFYAQCCFICQQAAEKALKALHYYGGARAVLGHSVRKLLQAGSLNVPEENDLLEKATLLDQFYIPTRYPNGLPEGSPFEAYTERQAKEAYANAGDFVSLAVKIIRGKTDNTASNGDKA
jgi:HEPN domain-containing protein